MRAHAVEAVEPALSRQGRDKGGNQGQDQGVRGLAIATFAFIVVFAASAVPIPLYSEYKGAIGLTDADISATMLMYLFGVVATECTMKCVMGACCCADNRCSTVPSPNMSMR